MTAAGAPQFDYLHRIWMLRYFWFSLVLNDVRSRYRRSFLGVGWSLLRPLGMTAIFCVVFGSLFQRDIRSYAPYVLLGMTTWQFLLESMIQGCSTFAQGNAYIRQQHIPHAIFPLRTVLGAGFHFSVALVLGIAIAAYFQGLPNVAALAFLPISLALTFVLCWSLAIIAGVAQTYFPDTSHLLEIGLQIFFYLTPIMYDPADFPNRGKFVTVLMWNPIQSILELFRQPILKGELPSLFNMGIALGFVTFATLTAWYLLRRLEKNLVFWL